MRTYVLKRLAGLAPILLGISFLAFLLINITPSDPAEVALRVNEITPTAEAVEEMRKELGLDQPFFLRYAQWLTGAFQGEFGNSYVNKKPVLQELLLALPATLALASLSLCLMLVLSLTIGVWCAMHEGSLGDRLTRAFVFISTAMPSFWLGLLLIWFFSVYLDLFPTSGMDGLQSLILPAVTLSLSYIATYVRLIRNSMIEKRQENYVQYARARGLKERTVIRHILKNSLQGSLTALGMSIPKLIAGTVIVENIFAWPGVGRLCVTAIFNRDYPVIQGYILMMAVLFVFCNLLVDIASAWLDPRLREER